MALNKVILFGRITRDPEIRNTTSGIPVCKFTVACDRPFANKQTGERECDFIDCQAWRQTAEFIARYFKKGDSITVDGSLRNNNWEKDGVKHYGYFVSAENVGFGGSKKEQQTGNYSVPQAVPAQGNMSASEIGQYEEVLSDGEVPF